MKRTPVMAAGVADHVCPLSETARLLQTVRNSTTELDDAHSRQGSKTPSRKGRKQRSPPPMDPVASNMLAL